MMDNTKKYGIQHYVDVLERENWTRERAEEVLVNAFPPAIPGEKMAKMTAGPQGYSVNYPWHGAFNGRNFKIAFMHHFEGQPLPNSNIVSARLREKELEAKRLEEQLAESELDAKIAERKAKLAEQVTKAKAKRKPKASDEKEVKPDAG